MGTFLTEPCEINCGGLAYAHTLPHFFTLSLSFFLSRSCTLASTYVLVSPSNNTSKMRLKIINQTWFGVFRLGERGHLVHYCNTNVKIIESIHFLKTNLHVHSVLPFVFHNTFFEIKICNSFSPVYQTENNFISFPAYGIENLQRDPIRNY